jgi:outer membrane protein
VQIEKMRIMKKIFFLWIGLGLLTACRNQVEKTAFVDMNRVVEEYKEMKKIKEEFQSKQMAFQKKYDSLATAFQSEYQEFARKANKMNQARAQEKYNALMAKQQQIGVQQQNEYQQLQADFDKATKEAMDKLKDFLRKFGKEQGYTYIFSKSELTGVAYGDESKDITDAFLKVLNGE